MDLPPWMLTPPAAEPWHTTPPAGWRTGRAPWNDRLVRHSLGHFAGLLTTVLQQDAIAARPGLLQALDARTKVLAVAALLITATLLHHWPMLAALLLVAVLLAAASRVPADLLTRLWLAAPLLSAFIVLPATLNVVTPGHPLWTLWQAATPGPGLRLLAVTDSGLLVAGRFVLRLLACVTLALLLTATTPTPRLFRGLRALGVPTLFVMLLSLMARYLAVLVRIAEELHLAKLSRSVAAGPAYREQAWLAAGIGELYRRSRALSDQVYLAMISRGYTGEVRLLAEPRWRRRDWAALAVTALFAAVLLWGDAR